MDRLFQQPMTLLSAIAVVLATAIIVSPKWLHWWSEWKKWQASQKVSDATSGGAHTSQTLAQNTNRSPITTWRFWAFTFDVLTGWACLMMLVSMSAEPAPATIGTVAFCATLVVFALSSLLRRW